MHYSPPFVKRRINGFMEENKFTDEEKLVKALLEDTTLFDFFICIISMPESEMFRDPQFWAELKENVFPELIKVANPLVYFPFSTTGEELYTFLICLHEAELLDKIKIIVSCPCQRNIDTIKSGTYNKRAFEISEANYKRFNPAGKIDIFTTVSGKNIILNPTLLRNTSFLVERFTKSNKDKFELVLFRNKLLGFQLSMQETIIETIYSIMNPKGFLALGVNDNKDIGILKNSFSEFNKRESIYRKV